MKDYRFKYQIEDENGEIVMQGSSYLTEIDEFGSCESVELELFSGLRALRRADLKAKNALPDDEEEEI